jgi:hypothetical protein
VGARVAGEQREPAAAVRPARVVARAGVVPRVAAAPAGRGALAAMAALAAVEVLPGVRPAVASLEPAAWAAVEALPRAAVPARARAEPRRAAERVDEAAVQAAAGRWDQATPPPMVATVSSEEATPDIPLPPWQRSCLRLGCSSVEGDADAADSCLCGRGQPRSSCLAQDSYSIGAARWRPDEWQCRDVCGFVRPAGGL